MVSAVVWIKYVFNYPKALFIYTYYRLAVQQVLSPPSSSHQVESYETVKGARLPLPHLPRGGSGPFSTTFIQPAGWPWQLEVSLACSRPDG